MTAGSCSFEEEIAAVEVISDTPSEETEPFKFKYQARKRLLNLYQDLKGRDAEDATSFGNQGKLELLLGSNYIECEEWKSGEDYLILCIDRFAKGGVEQGHDSLTPEHCRELFAKEIIDAYNQKGILWFSRQSFRKSYLALREAFNLYKQSMRQWTKSKNLAKQNGKPSGEESKNTQEGDEQGDGGVGDREEKTRELDNLHISTVYYLAQVYGRMGKATESAKMCHSCLQKQLTAYQKTGAGLDKVDWCRNALGLVPYYTSIERFQQGKHCLEAATKMMPEGALPISDTQEERDSHPMQQQGAELARQWGTFYLTILEASHIKANRAYLGIAKDEKKKPLPLLLFPELELGVPGACPVIDNFKDAANLFKESIAWLKKAKKYFVLEGYVTDNVKLTQSISRLYKVTATFEEDINRVATMHKRRVDMLAPLISELNPQVYKDFALQLSDETARAYGEMVAIRMAQNKERAPGPKQIKATIKINTLILNAIKYYSYWLRTWEDSKTSLQAPPVTSLTTQIDPKSLPVPSPPATLDEHYHLDFLTNLFSVARLWSKLFYDTVDPMVEAQWTAVTNYQLVIDIHKRYNMDSSIFEEELKICKEMAELLPVKINRMISTGVTFTEN